MEGLIKRTDVILNLPLIWREYGTGCAVRALRAVVQGQRTTFLEVAFDCERQRELARPPRVRA